MSGIWNKGQQPWRLPDSAEKAEGKPLANASDANKDDEQPTFEIDFSPSAPAFDGASVAGITQSAPEQQDSLGSLEIGSPGQFSSLQHDHGVRLAVESADAKSNPELPPQPAIVMVDEPLPESLSGGAAMQDLFVEEVLKGAQGIGSSSSALTMTDDQSTMISSAGVVGSTGFEIGSDKTLQISKSSIAGDDKTQITQETLREQTGSSGLGDNDKTIASLQPQSSTLGSVGQEISLAVDFGGGGVHPAPPAPPPSPGFVPEPPPALQTMGSAPGQASFSLEGSPTAAKSTDAENTKTKAGASAAKDSSAKADKTKVGAAGKDKPATIKKPAAGQGQKAKDGATNVKPVGGDKNNIAALSQTTNAVAPGPIKGISKEARIFLGFFIPAVLVFVFAVFKKLNRESVGQQMATEIVAPPKTQNSTPIAKPTATASKNDAKNNVAASAKPGKVVKDNNSADSESDEEGEDSDSEDNNEIELEHILTRPVSRYSETNKQLVPLLEISAALDRVQPRRVLTLMRGLPAGFGTTDAVQKVALREVTARYYMQVGAYQKAVILFRQICSDPAKQSDLEVCLHAARAAAVVGLNDEAKEIVSGLQVRLIGQNNQWKEWVRLIENAVALSSPSVEAFVKFSDDISDKGPFLTTEWNIQLSTLFARSLLLAPESVRNAYLKSVMSTRKKNIEVRLAPDKFGQDIGSYMMPAFINLMLRHYEYQQLNILGDEPEMDSELGVVAWVFNVIAQSKSNEPRETRARLAPLFAERGFSALARLIEGQLAAQAGDYVGAHAMIIEQIGPTLTQDSKNLPARTSILQTREFISATQRLSRMPFLFVEWLFLGVKVSAGLNDKESLKTYLVALEDARRRFPELAREIQYWFMISRANRVLGFSEGVERAVNEAAKLVSTPHESGFVAGDRVWLLMKRGQKKEAKVLMRKLLVEFPHHARLLELAAEFSASWGEEPSAYLRLEAEIPLKYQTRGRDSVLLSFFTLRKLLSNF
ncbi:MAG: hypothetical protein ACO3A4_10710 [Silvanigrellaceae bacterium]